MLDTAVEAVPIRVSGKMIYVGQTRVPLETVLRAFHRGATPEEIVIQYSALSLGDVYLVIGYYLNHRVEVDAYMTEAKAHAVQIRAENEARFDTTGLRERLLARHE